MLPKVRDFAARRIGDVLGAAVGERGPQDRAGEVPLLPRSSRS
jgi:hypothetical protein